MNYSPKYLRAESASTQAVEDSQVLALFQNKRDNAMADELSAMCKRNPNRQAVAFKMEAAPTEVPAQRQDATMLLVSGLMMAITLAVSLAQVLA